MRVPQLCARDADDLRGLLMLAHKIIILALQELEQVRSHQPLLECHPAVRPVLRREAYAFARQAVRLLQSSQQHCGGRFTH